MAVKMRLQRHGSKKRPFYFIVVADARSPRDGKFIEKLGTYNPRTVPATIHIDRQRALEWLHNGAQPSDTVRRILSFKGVLYLKHLLRGVKMGLFDEAAAMEKFTKWTEERDADFDARTERHKKAQEAKKPKYVKKEVEIKKVDEAEAPAAKEQPEAAPAEEEAPQVATTAETEAPATETEAPATSETEEKAEGTEDKKEAE